MNFYVSTITLQAPSGMFGTFVSVSASNSADEAIAEAYRHAVEQNPGWEPLKGTANAMDREKFAELSRKVLGS